ncbi:MotA/TolQ/ExbB proton channel family protein [Tautonia sociabilis]|uniref:MotA/TolQ/ExbB proton channel family protein n=1 Tax=Tautonia sociabilis TaxID=2080755 RepID=A0A432MQ64_9BACT|nr:MotA/TolQ/ExbB proton channel family protein [Tautonia sociabilis]RUL89621.1 MotA/TolQ/ExbB proton channel family protein [Tautonia sociabilis]
MPRSSFGFARLPGPARGLRPAVVVLVLVASSVGADRPSNWERATGVVSEQAQVLSRAASDWYRRTPPADRVTWGGLAACALLGLSVLAERSRRLRHGEALPPRFVDRFLDRVRDGQLDRTKGIDLCESHPSPASRVALAALRRWGRPASDLDRAVALAKQVEVDRMRRNVGTLRRIAALAPLIGLLGTLLAAGRALSALGETAGATAWGPALAGALAPLTAGVAVAILALVAYDGLMGRVEAISGALDRLGAETAEAIAQLSAAPAGRSPGGIGRAAAPRPHFDRGGSPSSRPAGPIRVEIPDALRDF